jgi:hypothetical protein
MRAEPAGFSGRPGGFFLAAGRLFLGGRAAFFLAAGRLFPGGLQALFANL